MDSSVPHFLPWEEISRFGLVDYTQKQPQKKMTGWYSRKKVKKVDSKKALDDGASKGFY